MTCPSTGSDPEVVAGAEPPQQGDAQDAAAREAATSTDGSPHGGAEAPAMNMPRKATGAPGGFHPLDSGFDPRPRYDECKVGGPHVFQRLDPRDADTWGRTGLACVECGAAPKENQ